MPLSLIIDNIQFEVWGDKTLWCPPAADDSFVDAPGDWARLARALVLCDYEDREGCTYVLDSHLHEHFIDTHDDDGNKVSGGRESGLHFPLKSGMPRVRPLRVMTGMLNGQKIVSVLEWDDPLNAVMTTKEAETAFGLAEGSIKKTAQRGKITSRKSGGTWLIRAADAKMKWG